jgi:exodeoxyribonuclease VII large subunit
MARDAGVALRGSMRLIVGLGPQSTLQRGFAIVKSIHGRPITSRAAAIEHAEWAVQFHDGTVQVANQEFERGTEP